MREFRRLVLDDLVGRGAASDDEVVALTEAFLAFAGNPIRFLVERGGYSVEDVLGAASTASGLPVAPRRMLERAVLVGADVGALRRTKSLPLGKRGGEETVAFADPEAALRMRATGGGPRAMLANPADVDDILEAMVGTRVDPAGKDVAATGSHDPTAAALEAFGAPDLPRSSAVATEDHSSSPLSDPLAPDVDMGLTTPNIGGARPVAADLDISVDIASGAFDGDTIRLAPGSRPITSQISSAIDLFSEETVLAQTDDGPVAGPPGMAYASDEHRPALASRLPDFLGAETEAEDASSFPDESELGSWDGVRRAALPRAAVSRASFREPTIDIRPPAPAAPSAATKGAPLGAARPALEAQRFEVVRALYKDAATAVYLATDRLTRKSATLEMLIPVGDVAPSLDEVCRQEERIRAAAHPSLAKVWSVAEANGRVLIVTERFGGTSLASHAHTLGGLSPALAVVVVARMVRILTSLHERGGLLSGPSATGVVVTPKGDLVVADLGFTSAYTARVRQRVRPRPPLLMPPRSPGLAQGLPPSVRSDLFAVGALGYEILTGRSHRVHALALAHGGDELPRPLVELCPSAPLALDEVLERLCTSRPDRRYESAHDALKDLEPLVDRVIARHPAVVPAFLDVAAAESSLRREQAAEEAELAARCTDRRPEEAFLRLVRARALAPDEAGVGSALERVSQAHRFVPYRSHDDVVATVEGRLGPVPLPPANVLLELGDFFRSERAPLHAAVCYRRALLVDGRSTRARQALNDLWGAP